MQVIEWIPCRYTAILVHRTLGRLSASTSESYYYNQATLVSTHTMTGIENLLNVLNREERELLGSKTDEVELGVGVCRVLETETRDSDVDVRNCEPSENENSVVAEDVVEVVVANMSGGKSAKSCPRVFWKSGSAVSKSVVAIICMNGVPPFSPKLKLK